MKKIILIMLACTIETQISMIRPNALFIVHSGTLDGIEWLDKTQPKPTQTEIDASLQNCLIYFNSTPVTQQNMKDLQATQIN